MTENFGEWWKNATDVERINYLITEKFAAFQKKDDQLIGTKLHPVTKITKKNRWVRIITEDGSAFFKVVYFKSIVDFCEPKEWFLTTKRYSKKNKNEYRLLVGLLKNNSYVLLAPIHPDPHITEAFE